MNALELADKLDEAADDLEAENIFAWEERAAATMLRQLQAENEAVKRDNINYMNDLGKAMDEIEALKKQNAKLQSDLQIIFLNQAHKAGRITT